jgi:hypothetical protein
VFSESRNKYGESEQQISVHNEPPAAARTLIVPHELDAEGAVLSAILLAAESIDVVQEFVEAKHFYADANRRIFAGVAELLQRENQ